jgi:hypothetical protein
VFNEDSINDVVEINTIKDEDPSIHMNPVTEKKVQKKRKNTLIVWTHFDKFSFKDPNDARI